MKVAVLSDTHGNLAAVEAVLAHAEALGASAVWNLGDNVDYCPQPNETMNLLRAASTVHLAGNHDLALGGRLPLDVFSDLAQACQRWSQVHVSDDHKLWLAGLEPAALLDGAVELYHGSPGDPAWGDLSSKTDAVEALVARPAARLVLVGHAHRQGAWRERLELDAETPRRTREWGWKPGRVFELGAARWVMNVGSVGFPNEAKDSDRRARWLLLDFAANTACFQATDYDRQRTKDAFAGTGLPLKLAKMI
jgi:predicted phosphodiesterase